MYPISRISLEFFTNLSEPPHRSYLVQFGENMLARTGYTYARASEATSWRGRADCVSWPNGASGRCSIHSDRPLLVHNPPPRDPLRDPCRSVTPIYFRIRFVPMLVNCTCCNSEARTDCGPVSTRRPECLYVALSYHCYLPPASPSFRAPHVYPSLAWFSHSRA